MYKLHSHLRKAYSYVEYLRDRGNIKSAFRYYIYLCYHVVFQRSKKHGIISKSRVAHNF